MMCDLCGQDVAPQNNLVAVQAVLCGINPLHIIDTVTPRHLLPVHGCKGDAHAGYVEAQYRRGGYPYDEGLAARWQEAYRRVQCLYGVTP